METALVPSRGHFVFTQAGKSVLQVLEEIRFPLDLYDRMLVLVNHQVIRDIRHVILNDQDRMEICVYPAGGGDSKNQIIASIAILAIAVVAGPLAGLFVDAAASPLLYAGVKAGITLVGSLLVSALIPPPSAGGASNLRSNSSAATAESPTYSLTGQSNQARLFARVPRVYGRHRVVPSLAATPQIENVFKTSEVRVMYDFGIGDLTIADIRVGDFDLDILDGEINVLSRGKGYATKDDMQIMGGSTAYNQLNYKLVENDTVDAIRTPTETRRAILDLTFPEGLVRFDQGGNRFMHSAAFRVQWRATGTTGPWTTVKASNYIGPTIEKEILDFDINRAIYNVPDITEPEFVDCWYIWTDVASNGVDLKVNISIFINGNKIYSQRYGKKGQNITEVEVGGTVYHRGALRDGPYVYDDKSRTTFELIEGIPAVPAGATGPLPVVVTARTGQPFVMSVRMNFRKTGQYDIRVTRLSEVSDTADQNTLRDQTVITMLRAIKRGPLVRLRRPHTMLEIEYIATEKLNGVVQNLSAICYSRLRQFNASGWIKSNNQNSVDGIRRSESSNPARIALDLLTGDAARFPLTDAQVHWPSFHRLQTICDTKIVSIYNGTKYRANRFEWNGVIEGDKTLREAVDDVLSVARAKLTLMSDGRYGVLIDERNTTPRQLITPANSWGFSGSRQFPNYPDALRVTFADEENDWKPADAMVYRDGFDNTNAVVIEDMGTFGITSYPEAMRYGRYMLAQGILRSEVFTVNMDVENLAVQRGDLVQVQHDVPAFGGQTFRVAGLPGGDSIILDQPLELSGNGWYTVRGMNGVIRTGRIKAQRGPTELRVDDITNFALDGLVAIGLTDPPVRDYIVRDITPSEDLTAALSLVKYDERVYSDADDAPLPDWDPDFGRPLLGKTRVEIQWKGVTQDWEFDRARPYTNLRIEWEPIVARAQYAGATVEARIGNSPWEVWGTAVAGETYIEKRFEYDMQEVFENKILLRITAVNWLGYQAPAIRQEIDIAPFDQRPGAPEDFFADVRGEEVHMFWEHPPEPGVVNYVIRYSPKTVGAGWSRSQHLARLPNDTTAFSIGARTGTYMIRSENIIGRMSPTQFARTTVEELPDRNVVVRADESTTWPGTLSGFRRGLPKAWSYVQITKDDGSTIYAYLRSGVLPDVELADGVSHVTVVTDIDIPANTLVTTIPWNERNPRDPQRAIYEFGTVTDLGRVFEVRLKNLLVASSIASYISLYSPYDVRQQAALATPEDDIDNLWNAWLEYRGIDQLKSMATWGDLTITTLPNLQTGNTSWSRWRKVRVGDVTARFLQFRIVARGFRRDIRVLIHEAAVRIDVPDRTWRKDNITVATTGVTRVNYRPAFMAKPVVAVTLDGVGTAVSYKITNHDMDGFDIRLFDASGTAVGGQIDVAALGYGRQRNQGI